MTKTILVTGASRGIGRATSTLCGARGWSVGVNYKSQVEAADGVVADIVDRGGKAIALQADVSIEDDVIRLFDQLERAFGPLDGVVVNAGITAPSLPLVDMSGERLRRTFEVNTFGAYLCAREAARRLSTGRGGRGGSIVLVSSVAARLGSPNEFVDYAGAKAAIDTLTIGLSKELGREGVRVNAIRPGLIETDIHASGGDPDRAQRLGATTPFGRAGHPSEVAEAIVWLLSDAASYTSGAILDVSGGR
ncbi:SDR family oxidoreductase [Lichenihabitans psoromatis]|uniref:SDR family oxidoreductase n=1 Tax=Lichenihabitans psoromatis TaxID=2528642 RepID=UPI001038314B|nr:SDR family oxidoreductase [Lichenihabitans psoromatis]